MNNKSNKRKLTLLVEDNLVKTLKVKAIQYDMSVSGLVELLARAIQDDKKLVDALKDKYIKEWITKPCKRQIFGRIIWFNEF